MVHGCNNFGGCAGCGSRIFFYITIKIKIVVLVVVTEEFVAFAFFAVVCGTSDICDGCDGCGKYPLCL